MNVLARVSTRVCAHVYACVQVYVCMLVLASTSAAQKWASATVQHVCIPVHRGVHALMEALARALLRVGESVALQGADKVTHTHSQQRPWQKGQQRPGDAPRVCLFLLPAGRAHTEEGAACTGAPIPVGPPAAAALAASSSPVLARLGGSAADGAATPAASALGAGLGTGCTPQEEKGDGVEGSPAAGVREGVAGAGSRAPSAGLVAAPALMSCEVGTKDWSTCSVRFLCARERERGCGRAGVGVGADAGACGRREGVPGDARGQPNVGSVQCAQWEVEGGVARGHGDACECGDAQGRVLHRVAYCTGSRTAQGRILHRVAYCTGSRTAQGRVLLRVAYCTESHTAQGRVLHRVAYCTGI